MNIFVVFLSVLCLSSGLYFHIGETEKKCFIEDIPDDTMVVGKTLFIFREKSTNHHQQQRKCIVAIVIRQRSVMSDSNACEVTCNMICCREIQSGGI